MSEVLKTAKYRERQATRHALLSYYIGYHK